MLRIEPLNRWDRFVPEWVEESGAVWLTRREAIFRADNIGAEPVHVATVPAPQWKRVAARMRLAQRALRFSCYNLVPRPDGSLFVAFDRSVALWTRGGWQAVGGLVRQFRILRGCCALAPDGSIYFGEYFDNAARDVPVNIYRLAAGARDAEIVHTFPPGAVRHIHGVHYDRFADELVVCTGDRPEECRVLRSGDRFGTLSPLGAGDETWRTIQPQFMPDAIYYATDAEFRSNHIYRVDRSNGQRTQVTEIDGPSYYSTTIAGHPMFATTAELCPSQKAPKAVIWAVGEGSPFPLREYGKDLMRMKALVPGFQAGIVQFPAAAAPLQARVPFTGSGLIGLEGKMYILVDGQ